MDNLEKIGIEISLSEFPNLEYVRTLEYFDGDLLNEYRCGDQTYLESWKSCDKTSHRWMIWRVDPKHVERYLHRQMPYLHLMRSNKDSFIYLQDIESSSGTVIRIAKTTLSELPSNYLPHPRARHHKEDEPNE